MDDMYWENIWYFDSILHSLVVKSSHIIISISPQYSQKTLTHIVHPSRRGQECPYWIHNLIYIPHLSLSRHVLWPWTNIVCDRNCIQLNRVLSRKIWHTKYANLISSLRCIWFYHQENHILLIGCMFSVIFNPYDHFFNHINSQHLLHTYPYTLGLGYCSTHLKAKYGS